MRANYDGIESDYCDVPEPIPTHGKALHLHDRTVTAVEEDGDGVRIFWKSSNGVEGSLVADRVVGADGPSSTIRSLFTTGVGRSYAGYCALRGTIREAEVSDAAREVFSERFTFYHGPGIQILAYPHPGREGYGRGR